MARWTFRWLLVLVAIVATGTGCKQARLKLGLGYEVTDPEEESPQWVVKKVIEAGGMEPFDTAFTEFEKYLHSDERSNHVAMKDWEVDRFPAHRRKNKCYVKDADKKSFMVMEERAEDGKEERQISLYVKCSTTDMPTPCHLWKDDKQGGKWRIRGTNCLN